MSEHTKEPWVFRMADKYHEGTISGKHGGTVVNGHFSEDNARRIVACVNACAGLPTEALHAISEALGTDEGHSSVYWIEQLKAALKTDQEPVAWLYVDPYNKLKLSQVVPHEDGAFPVYRHPAPVVSSEPF